LGAPRQRADVETLPSGRAPFCRAIVLTPSIPRSIKLKPGYAEPVGAERGKVVLTARLNGASLRHVRCLRLRRWRYAVRISRAAGGDWCAESWSRACMHGLTCSLGWWWWLFW